MATRIDKEKTKKTIADILDTIKTEADPRVLNEYRAIFKKEVSLFRRSWAAAYLLMLFEQNNAGYRGGRDKAGKNRKALAGTLAGTQADTRAGAQTDARGDMRADTRTDARPAGGKQRKRSLAHTHGGADAENRGIAPDNAGSADESGGESRSRQYPLAEEDSRRIFISIGRNRRVFPREILGLIIAKTGVSRDDIGAIRILENYSFVQVRTTVAEQIIEALDSQVFRGRTLTVNFAKARRDGDESQENQDRDDSAKDDTLFTDARSPEYSDNDGEYPETDDADLNGDTAPPENTAPEGNTVPPGTTVPSETTVPPGTNDSSEQRQN